MYEIVFVENNNFTASFLSANDFENEIRIARERYRQSLVKNQPVKPQSR